MADRRRPPIVVFIIVLVIGLIGLFSVTRSPDFDSYRTVHVITLIASGACFGAATVGIFVSLLRPKG
jgi:hypothetical protein